MIFFWQMPRHREAIWIEHVIDNFLFWVWKKLVLLIYDTRFEYWLLDPDGQFYTLCLTTILVTTIWWLISRESSHKIMREAPQADVYIIEKVDAVNQPAASIRTSSTHNPDVMRSVAPPHHHPTNARLEGSPFSVTHPFGNADRTGRLSTPGYQTPFGITTHARNFASLAKDAPTSYDTLQELGMLNWDGTPTKKWKEKQEMRCVSSGKGKGKKPVKEPVAYWTNDLGRMGGRAVMLQEVDGRRGFLDESDDEHFFA